MSEEKSEDSIEFDLDEILGEDISDDNLPQIEVEEIEELVVVETEGDTDDDGATFQDQTRQNWEQFLKIHLVKLKAASCLLQET